MKTKPSPPAILLMIALLVSGLTSCSKHSGGNETISVSENDADMNAAIAKARARSRNSGRYSTTPSMAKAIFV